MGAPKPIQTEAEYDAALARIWQLWDIQEGDPSHDELDALVGLVERYEEAHYPMDSPSPAAAIEFRMEQEGLTPEDLAPEVGTPAEIAEVFAGKREITLSMAQALHNRLGIPYDSMLEPSKAGAATDRGPEATPRSRQGEATR